MEGSDPGPAPLTEPPADSTERPDWAEVEPPDYDEQPSWDEVADPAPGAVAEPAPAVVAEPVPAVVAEPEKVEAESVPAVVAEPVTVEAPAVEEPVATVEPVERFDPAQVPDPEPAPVWEPDGKRSSALLPIALGLVLLVLLGAVGWLAMGARDTRSRDDARQAALQAARQEAVNLTTISYGTADADLGRIIASATGTLKTQFEAQRAQFPAVLAQDKSVSVGSVLAAGVASQSSSTVEALVAVDAAVSNAATAKGDGRPVVKHYRMDMKLVLVGGRWLVSQVAFAGLPQ